MGLYLAIFDGDEELDGVEVGAYSDFAVFRDAVVNLVEAGLAGSRCPTLINHSDCDGQWTPNEAIRLEIELLAISERFRQLPAQPLDGEWKPKIAKMFGLMPANLYDCFFDVDGEPLLERLLALTKLSEKRNLPIVFQ
ncbi:Imm70 family immunity protein [Rhizobium herbae]|uniref:Uncharacterized protein n=1 Tax=Rhizobium herbae TaxID=508661 RepID=A0ABS4EP40_9HYPH|nr:Imm70 family immunity protein [Rhizobium herbae]MBP1859709.1 hypothetical protein [Rhizobium herbae]